MRYVGVALIVALFFVACGGKDESEAFCDVAREVEETDPSQPDLDEIRRLTEELRDAAPDEIKDEAETFAEGIEQLAEGDTSALTDEFNEAAEKIGEYGQENCDIEE
jgi:hypothetical protein